ncbi:Uncharacterised protein [Mycobacteroides abscessus subsp. bolletii]|uniref:hypothetical protein n=1 Tax=Mycobacteroides abscessus TaxID=36809 RepID=UPI0009A66F64|nr:hypothetical protein [Mycobacteroides abscessus]SKV05589.1 Uncharacterised protein [Mycobacteroides abscessus subsp. bolletii]
MTTTGYLTSFAAAYQVEGVTQPEATAIASRVQQALTNALDEIATTIAFDEAGHDRKVLAVRVVARCHKPEEYDIR